MFKVKKVALLLGAAFCAQHSVAHAGERFDVIPASGHPLDNVARSSFSIFDQKVTNSSSTTRVWVTHFQRRTGTNLNGTAGAIQAFPNVMPVNQGQHRLCRFDSSGNWTGCTAFTALSPTSVLSLATQETVHLQTQLLNGGTLHTVVFWYNP